MAVKGLELWLAGQFADQDERVAVDAGWTPVVESIGKLPITADHQRRLEADTRGTVMSACSFVAAHR